MRRKIIIDRPFEHCGRRFTPRQKLTFVVERCRGTCISTIHGPGYYDLCWVYGIRGVRRLLLMHLCGLWDAYAIYGGPMTECAHDLARWLHDAFEVTEK